VLPISTNVDRIGQMNARPANAPAIEEILRLGQRVLGQSPHAPHEGMLLVRPLPGLRLLRHVRSTAFEATIYEPVVCLILQGLKEMTFGERSFRMGTGECLLVSHELPVVSRILDAPYLALLFDVNIQTLRSLHEELEASPRDGEGSSALAVHTATFRLLDALGRYLALAESATDAKVLAPLISKEIHYRLLLDPVGGMLRSLLRYDSHAALVSRAINVIRRDFRISIVVAELAREVGMSVSSFHRHFRSVTSVSPLQYQKELRLLEARRLLRGGAASVSATAFEVGYESLSQFSREYSRKFGRAPTHDMAGLPTRNAPLEQSGDRRLVP
jgi:AraC-like DNA-binding protein